MQFVDAPLSPPARAPAYSQLAQFLFLLGGMALLLGPTLPWLELRGAQLFHFSGLQRTGGEAILILALGGAVCASALFSIWRERDQTMMVPFFFGISGGLMALVYFNNLRDSIAGFESQMMSASVGGGLYLCLGGGVLVLMGLSAAWQRSSARV